MLSLMEYQVLFARVCTLVWTKQFSIGHCVTCCYWKGRIEQDTLHIDLTLGQRRGRCANFKEIISMCLTGWHLERLL